MMLRQMPNQHETGQYVFLGTDHHGSRHCCKQEVI